MVVAIAALLGWLLMRRRNRRLAWRQQADGLVRDATALSDLGATGPVTPDAQQQVAHWSTLEQRATDLLGAIAAASPDSPDDATNRALQVLAAATEDYRTSVRNTRQLRVGPPAPTAEQLELADAISTQRLADLRGATDQLRRTAGGASSG